LPETRKREAIKNVRDLKIEKFYVSEIAREFEAGKRKIYGIFFSISFIALSTVLSALDKDGLLGKNART
jgi:hypothetical protein